MGKLVAIGGGEIATGETRSIDKQIVSLTGKKRPRALFVPTASIDSRDYCKVFQNVYGTELGCEVDVLYLFGVSLSKDELEQKILSSDLIYVGGGNTLKMMRRWRSLGVDRVLRDAYAQGIVLSGLSAGCICWFSWGHSDAMRFYHPENWRYIRVRGMGLIDALCCPHFDSDTAGVGRELDFRQMVLKHSDVALGIDDGCALEVVDDYYRVISSQANAGIYKLTRLRREISIERVEQREGYEPLAGLLRTDRLRAMTALSRPPHRHRYS